MDGFIIKRRMGDINNHDYLMIKGSNSTGLYKLAKALKVGKINDI